MPGSNDIKGGVTIDLGKLKNVTLSKNKRDSIASVQPGAKWGDVYKLLDPLGYIITGGKGGNVGVGSTLGGGLSFYNNLHGWSCDSVKNFEIVLSNGTLSNANAQTNADLFKALKGGLGNFGIVTRYDFFVYKSGPLWGGTAFYNFSDIEKFYQPIVDLANTKDPYGTMLLTYSNNATTGKTLIGNVYDYLGNATEKKYYASTDPPGTSNPFPAPLAPFAFDKVGKPNVNSLRIDRLYGLTSETNGANNSRYLISNILFKSDVKILTQVDRIAQAALKPYMDKEKPYPYLEGQVQYQPYPGMINEIGIKNGGNVLGLDRVGNSINFVLLFQWKDPSQDKFLQKFSDSILSNVTTYLKSVNGFRNWQFAGLSSADQDVIGSYGQKNVDFLKGVSKKYDPEQVFQKLVPGWKVDNAGKINRQYNFNQFVSYS